VLSLNDFDGFVRAVGDLIGNTGKRSNMSARNRTDVEQFFIENCAARYEALFNRIVGRPA
jgi:glycosyltransferase involved in cell wall biosynthesis